MRRSTDVRLTRVALLGATTEDVSPDDEADSQLRDAVAWLEAERVDLAARWADIKRRLGTPGSITCQQMLAWNDVVSHFTAVLLAVHDALVQANGTMDGEDLPDADRFQRIVLRGPNDAEPIGVISGQLDCAAPPATVTSIEPEFAHYHVLEAGIPAPPAALVAWVVLIAGTALVLMAGKRFLWDHDSVVAHEAALEAAKRGIPPPGDHHGGDVPDWAMTILKTTLVLAVPAGALWWLYRKASTSSRAPGVYQWR